MRRGVPLPSAPPLPPPAPAMAQAALGAAGLHFDELNKLRVLEPEAAQQTAQLREECRAFLDSESPPALPPPPQPARCLPATPEERDPAGHRGRSCRPGRALLGEGRGAGRGAKGCLTPVDA